MAVSISTLTDVNPSRQRVEDLRDPDRRNPHDAINDQSYRIVDNMRLQSGDLDDISDYNSQEDSVRARLGRMLKEQERALVSGESRLSLDLNRRAQRALALVDALDAAQGLNEIKGSIGSAQALNRDTAEAGLAILAQSEPRTLHSVAGGLQ